MEPAVPKRLSSTRRALLVSALGVAGAAAYLATRKTLPAGPRAPLRCLDARSYAILVAVADAVCPGGIGLPRASELDVAGQLDALWARMDEGVARDVMTALALIESAAVGALFDARWNTFSALPPSRQTEALGAFRDSRLLVRRGVFKAIRGFVVSVYWNDPANQAAIGYPGAPPLHRLPLPEPQPWASDEDRAAPVSGGPSDRAGGGPLAPGTSDGEAADPVPP